MSGILIFVMQVFKILTFFKVLFISDRYKQNKMPENSIESVQNLDSTTKSVHNDGFSKVRFISDR